MPWRSPFNEPGRTRPGDAGRAPRACATLLALSILAGCGDDPVAGIPVCGEEPALRVGDTVEGGLGPQDARFDGAPIDYFSLSVPDSTHLRLTLSSTELDPLLFLFDVNGRVTAQAFDPVGQPPGETEIAQLIHRVPPGCTLVGASAWDRDATGTYRLRVDEEQPPPGAGTPP